MEISRTPIICGLAPEQNSWLHVMLKWWQAFPTFGQDLNYEFWSLRSELWSFHFGQLKI